MRDRIRRRDAEARRSALRTLIKCLLCVAPRLRVEMVNMMNLRNIPVVLILLLSAALTLLTQVLQAQNARPAYLDPSQPIEARIADLISQMTLEEKAAE